MSRHPKKVATRQKFLNFFFYRMSVVGIDLGNDGMVISVPCGQGQGRGKGGIDIVLNEASHRRTQ